MDDTDSDTLTVWGLTYWGWAVVYLVAMAAAFAAFVLGLGPAWLMLVPLVMVPAMTQAQMKWLGTKGIGSPALARYARRFLLASFAYLVCFLGAAKVYDRFEPGKAVTLGLAALSVLPVLAMIWIVVRYLAEETDEYLRGRAVVSVLFGLFFVLVLGSLWGFLEMFGLLPGLWAWWVFPTWAIGLGLGHGWQWLRGR
jgi:hypothetical protein